MIVKSEMMPCNTCGAPAAMMIIAHDANTVPSLEYYAELMLGSVQEWKVPSWVVGREREVLVDGKLVGEALVLKLWPVRGAAQIIYSTELNAIFSELMENHCSPQCKAYH